MYVADVQLRKGEQWGSRGVCGLSPSSQEGENRRGKNQLVP